MSSTLTLHRPKSEEIYKRATAVIPGGVNSPVRAFYGMNMAPLIVERGEGDTIWDADGNGYIDYCGSWGSLILGHAHPRIVAATREQIGKGSSFGIATPLEMEIAETVVSRIPSIEKLRFVSSGTEATMSALRLARGFTGRDLIVKFNGNYHGHSDCLLAKAGSGVTALEASSSAGVPREIVAATASLPFNDIETARRFLLEHADTIAAVILEPIAGNMGTVPAKKEFLLMLREITQKIGAVLIFDEVISGFRVHPIGAQALFGITPDMTCLGKIVGGGYPAAAFGGKKEIMECIAPLGPVYQAGTLSGNPVAMCAGLHTLQEIGKPGFYEELQRKTNLLLDPIDALLRSRDFPLCLQRVGSMFTLFWGLKKVEKQEDLRAADHSLFQKAFTFLLEQGVYFAPSPFEASFVSIAHTDEHLKKTRDLLLEFISSLRD